MSPWGPLFRQVLQKFAKSQGRRILTRVGTRLAAGAAAAGGAGAAAGAAKAGAAAAASGAATAGTTAAGTAAAAGGGQILRTGKTSTFGWKSHPTYVTSQAKFYSTNLP